MVNEEMFEGLFSLDRPSIDIGQITMARKLLPVDCTRFSRADLKAIR